MSHNPDLRVRRVDLRDRFVDVIVTIVMVLLATYGWFAYLGG